MKFSPIVEELDSGELQLRYNLPHHIHVSNVYPLPSPNGSEIIICGHENGLLILWRGGRPLKQYEDADQSASARVNGSDDSVMLVDSGDAQSLYEDQPEFEDEEQEYDPSHPYQPIIQHLDLPLGTAVLHMSFPDIRQRSGIDLAPELLKQFVVVAVACADSTLKLLSLPLTPPSPQSKSRSELQNDISLANAGHGSWGEQMGTIRNASIQQSLLRDISIAFVPRSATLPATDAMDEDDEAEIEEATSVKGLEGLWDILVASYSSDLSGILNIHKIALSDDGLSLDMDEVDHRLPWRSHILTTQAVAIKLCVPVNSSSEIQYPRVLVAQVNGTVKILECCTPSHPKEARWSLALYPRLTTVSAGVPREVSVLDVQWVLDGMGIAVLLADGEWGIWELSGGKSNTAIAGNIPTKFTFNGWVGGSPITSTTSKSSSGKVEARSRLAPMTPGIRKVRQEALFSGTPSKASYSTCGGMSVSSMGPAKANDEQLLIWYGQKIITINNLRAHMQSKGKASSDVFGIGTSNQREIAPLNHGGEIRNAVSIFPCIEDTTRTLRPVQQDVLISGDRSLIILTTPLPEPQKSAARAHPPVPVVADQLLLTRGELDIFGMDRILDGMANGSHNNKSYGNGVTQKKKVTF